VPGKKHSVADGLSRRPRTEFRRIDDAYNIDLDNVIDIDFFALWVGATTIDNDEPALKGEYSEYSYRVATWLILLRRLPDMNNRQFNQFRKDTTRFIVKDRQLSGKGPLSAPLRAVVDLDIDRDRILKRSIKDMATVDEKALIVLLQTDTSGMGCFEMSTSMSVLA